MLINIKNPLVSVLMTAYNREKYIAEAIESVLVSSYTNFELIIVDDGSTDNSVNIAMSFAAKDRRIKMYVNPKNLGDYPNRNLAASYATGKYLKYIDSDDYIYSNGLEVLVKSMEAFPEAGLGLCTLSQNMENPFPFMLQPKEGYEYHFFGPGLFHKGPLSAIFVTEAFNGMGGFATGRMISDTDMWFRMGLKYPVVLIADGIVWQRRHAEQEMAFQHRYIYQGEKIKWKYLYDPECKLSMNQIKSIKNRRLKRYTGFIISGLKRFNFQQVIIYSKCFWFVLKINVGKQNEKFSNPSGKCINDRI